MQQARKALKRERISCDGFKKGLREVVSNDWNPEDDLELFDQFEEAMNNLLRCSNDVIALHDDSGDEEQKDVDSKHKAMAENRRVLNDFKTYRA